MLIEPIGKSGKSAIVLGAGISGLTVAYGLRQQGYDVCLIDEYDHPGGNHISDNIGGMTFDIGAIFLWGHSHLFNMFPSLRPLCVPVEWRTDRINPAGRVVSYPFDPRNELWTGSPSGAVSVVASLFKHRLSPLKKDNARSYLTHYLGEELLKVSGLESYIERLYGLPSSEISYEFASARLQYVERVTRPVQALTQLVRNAFNKSGPPDSQCLARPAIGFSEFYKHAVSDLSELGVRTVLGARLKSVYRERDTHIVETSDGDFVADRLVSTIPLQHIGRLTGIDTSDVPSSLPLHSLYWKFKGKLGFIGPVLYNFQHHGAWKRLTLHSQYYGDVDDYSYFSTETTALPGAHLTPDDCERDFRESIKACDILDGELELVGSRQTDFAYPLYDQTAAKRRNKIIGSLQDIGIECVGRQGAFEYLPVAGIAIQKAQHYLEDTKDQQTAPETPDIVTPS